MADVVPTASTSPKHPSPPSPTSATQFRQPQPPSPQTAYPQQTYPQAPTPSAISISSGPPSPAAEREIALQQERLPVPDGTTTHARVVSSSSSAAAGDETDNNANPVPTSDANAPTVVKKPKSRRPRVPSPSPPPAPRPPPPMTVRLEIQLGGPSNYEINILQLAKETGQRHPTPPPPPRLNSDTESSSEEEAPENPNPIRRRRRRRDYDLDDPFIDDSDLRIDAPTHFAQTKQSGFYVSSGDVALVKDKTTPKLPLKPTRLPETKPRREAKSLTALLMAATAVAEAPAKVHYQQQGNGTRDSPIALDDDEENGGGDSKPPHSPITGSWPAPKRIKLDDGASMPVDHNDDRVVNLSTMSIGPSDSMLSPNDAMNPNGKKRKISKEGLEKIFHPDVTKALHTLKTHIDGANWTVKGKFPPQLKPLLQETAKVALQHGDYNDNFFDYLPTIFPYNRFTMMKLTSRLMYQDHQKYIAQRQEALLEELRQIATDTFGEAQTEFLRASNAWDEKQRRKAMALNGASDVEMGLAPGAGAMDVDAPASRAQSPSHAESDAPATKAPGTREREEKPPQQKYRWTDAIKTRVWGLVHLSNESARLTSIMHGWDANVPVTTEQSLRKNLYTRITAVFPEGWMNSTTISREVSNMKVRLKKEAEAGAGANVNMKPAADDE